MSLEVITYNQKIELERAKELAVLSTGDSIGARHSFYSMFQTVREEDDHEELWLREAVASMYCFPDERVTWDGFGRIVAVRSRGVDLGFVALKAMNFPKARVPHRYISIEAAGIDNNANVDTVNLLHNGIMQSFDDRNEMMNITAGQFLPGSYLANTLAEEHGWTAEEAREEGLDFVTHDIDTYEQFMVSMHSGEGSVS